MQLGHGKTGSGIIQRQILKPKGESIGIDGLGWHTFRHTYRSLLDETGAPIGVQQKLMRHANGWHDERSRYTCKHRKTRWGRPFALNYRQDAEKNRMHNTLGWGKAISPCEYRCFRCRWR